MNNIAKIQLSDYFKLFAPSHVLGTTFSISLAFFESVVYPVINKTRLQRCVLMCDSLGFQRLTQEATSLRWASQGYMTVTAPSAGTFHPKVWLMMNEDELALLVGSGNLTQTGFMWNAELFDLVHINKNKLPPKHIISDITEFLSKLYGLWDGINTEHFLVLTALKEMIGILERMSVRNSSNKADQMRFITSLSGPLIDQLPEVSNVNCLLIASPYFGKSVKALSMLINKFNPQMVKVYPGIHPDGSVDVNIADIVSMNNATVHAIRNPKKGSFAHLKLYGVDDSNAQPWLFCGSANCTLEGLSGKNIEAGILRYVSREELYNYFQPDEDRKVPDALAKENFLDDEGIGWFNFWATDLGNSIELIAPPNEKAKFPLKDVLLTMKTGSNVSEFHCPSIFLDKPTEKIPWEWFEPAIKARVSSILLEISATTNNGNKIQSAAFVDNYWMLSSGPVHRSAWRASLALLQGEGLPEFGDVAAVFALGFEMFDFENFEKTEKEKKNPNNEDQATTQEMEDKVAFWPPTPICGHHISKNLGNPFGHIYWSQKILDHFLRPERNDGGVTSDPETAFAENEEDDHIPANKPVNTKLLKASEKVWVEADKNFNVLCSRLQGLILTPTIGSNVWPISIFIMLVTLAVRRKIGIVNNLADLPKSHEILYRFTNIMFAHRNNTRGILPPISELLAKEYQVYPHKELCTIVLAIFAYLWALGNKNRIRDFHINNWLMFRNIAENTFAEAISEFEHIQRISESYLIDQSDGLSLENIKEGLKTILKIGWEQQQGYLDLKILKMDSLHKGSKEILTLSEHLRLSIEPFLRRLGKSHAFKVVEPSLQYCIGERCPKAYVINPAMGRLRNLCPVICTSCGAVLVPQPLNKAFLEHCHGSVTKSSISYD